MHACFCIKSLSWWQSHGYTIYDLELSRTCVWCLSWWQSHGYTIFDHKLSRTCVWCLCFFLFIKSLSWWQSHGYTINDHELSRTCVWCLSWWQSHGYTIFDHELSRTCVWCQCMHVFVQKPFMVAVTWIYSGTSLNGHLLRSRLQPHTDCSEATSEQRSPLYSV